MPIKAPKDQPASTEPTITVFHDRETPGMKGGGGSIEACTLADALSREWPVDAHITAYEPRTGEIEDRKGKSLGRQPMRLLHEAHDDRPAVYECLESLNVPNVRMVALIGDIDDPVAHTNKTSARAEWRVEQLPKLEASGLACYETRGGYRVLATVDFVITTREDAEAWKELYLGWCEHLKQTHGLVLDDNCKDWTRFYRLPNVVRDGDPQRSEVLGSPPAFDRARHWRKPSNTKTKAKSKPSASRAADDAIARAHAEAWLCDKSISGNGGDEALFKAARRISDILGEDAAAIETVLSETFNPRCEPPWEASKIKREATRAAEHQATPEARLKRASEATWRARAQPKVEPEPEPEPKAQNGTKPESDEHLDALGADPGLDAACEELDWLIEGLQIAPGKVTLITAYAGGSKTPTASLIAVCVAAGVPCLGHPVKRARVLYLATEAGRNVRRKIIRIAKGLGVDARQLVADGWLRIRDTNALDNETGVHLEAAIVEHELGMVIVDTITSALRGSDVGRNEEAYARALWDLGSISERTRCVVLGLAHDNKSATGADLRGTSGSSAIVEAAATVVRLEPSPTDDKLIKVSCARAPDDRFPPFGVRWVDDCERFGTAAKGNVGVPLRCELDGDALADRRGSNPINAKRADEKAEAMRVTAPRVLDAIKDSGGSCNEGQIETAAGDVSKRVRLEVLARLKKAGAVAATGSYFTLSPGWRSWPNLALRARVEAAMRAGADV